MQLLQFKHHKKEWWKNYKVRLESLKYLFINSSYNTYNMDMQKLFDKNCEYIKYYIDLNLFPLDLQTINIPQHKQADQKLLNLQLIPFIEKSIKQIDFQIQRLDENITYLISILNDKINQLKYIEYKTNWNDNFQYCKFSFDEISSDLLTNLREKNIMHQIDSNTKIITFLLP